MGRGGTEYRFVLERSALLYMASEPSGVVVAVAVWLDDQIWLA